MIKIPLKEYVANKDKYKEYRSNTVSVRCVDRPQVVFNINYLPEPLTDDDGNVIPGYIKNEAAKNRFTALHGPTPVDSFIVEINDIVNAIYNGELNISKSNFINMDDYTISEDQHWLNRAVLKFYKDTYKNSIIFVNDLVKAKKLFKQLSTRDNVPMEYKKILQLFSLTGSDDKSFEVYIKTKFK